MFVRSSCRLIAHDLSLDEAEESIKNRKFCTKAIAHAKKQSDTSSLKTELYLSIESGLLSSFYNYSFSVV